LQRFDPKVAVSGLVLAAARSGLPMAVVDVDADEAAALYPRKLLLSRPDQHVAWRGDELPDDPMGLIDRVRGASVRAKMSAQGYPEGRDQKRNKTMRLLRVSDAGPSRRCGLQPGPASESLQ